MLLFRCEQEIIQKLGNTHFLSVSQVNIFGYILYDINHFHLFVKLQSVLAIITETNRFTDIEPATVGLHLSHQHFNKSRFPGTVITDNPHLFVTGKYIVEIFYNLEAAKTFRHMFGLEYLRTDIGSLDIQIHVSVIMLLFSFLLQFIKSIDTIFSLRSTGLRLPAHPFQFLT